MKKYFLLFVIPFMFLSANVQAGWTSTNGTVEEVTSHYGVHLLKTTIPDSTCTGNGLFWWRADDPNAKDMLSIALAAFMSGKKVMLVHDTDNPECRYERFNKATHIKIMH